MSGQLQEVARDFGSAANLAVQEHEGTRALWIEGAAMQQVGQRADGREAVVQRIEHVGRAFVEDDVLHVRRGCGGFRGWRW